MINQEKLQTPCFVLDAEEFSRSVKGFQKALDSNFVKSIVGYSVKTNSTPYCLKKACDCGAYAEVVSYDEYELAKLCGFAPNKIIYNGPMKSRESFLEALENGAVVNIETKREMHWLLDLDATKNHEVGIRLNVNISHISPEDADGDNDDSRFGFSDETNEFAEAVELIAKLPNVALAGLHIHRTAHSRSVRFYENLVDFACQIIEKYKLKLHYLDVGGGYFGIFKNKPTYQQYSDAIYGVLSKHGLADLAIIVEPGNALVASCFTFVSTVIDIKEVEPRNWFVTTDGSRNDIDPFFKKEKYIDEEIYNKKTEIVDTQIVTGCTCLEYDRLFTLLNKPRLSVGDKIVYHNVGAYTMSLTPMFIRYVPNIYVKKAKDYVLIRKKFEAKDCLLNTVF